MKTRSESTAGASRWGGCPNRVDRKVSSTNHALRRRDALRLLAAGALVSRTSPWLLAQAPIRSPNILLIQADDLGWNDLGCYGAGHYSTPAIDRLAHDGLRFTQAYSGSAICTPSRACLLTGLHCARLRITGQASYKTEDTSTRRFAHPDFRTQFPAGTPCIGHTLTKAGYHTAIFGKWGFDDGPQSHGFAEVTTGSDEALVESALGLLGRDSTRPFFAYVNFSRPHVPLKPVAARVAAFAARREYQDGRYNPTYAAELEAMDRATGRLLAGLDRAGQSANTLVMFTSDNGGFLGYDHERIADNAPLREGKASLYEGGIRVPLIIRWPGVTKPGTTSDSLVHGVDWHSTLAEVTAGVAPASLDGQSFAASLRGGRMLRTGPLHWHYPHYRRSMAGIAASPSSAIRDGEWKLIHFYESNGVELYHLRDDLGESRNLSSALPGKAATLRRQLDTWRAAVGAQPPVPNPRPL